MKRRNFLAALCALPIVGKWMPKVEAAPVKAAPVKAVPFIPSGFADPALVIVKYIEPCIYYTSQKEIFVYDMNASRWVTLPAATASPE